MSGTKRTSGKAGTQFTVSLGCFWLYLNKKFVVMLRKYKGPRLNDTMLINMIFTRGTHTKGILAFKSPIL